MSVLTIVPHSSGVRTVQWTAEDVPSVEHAAAMFRQYRGDGYGYLAYQRLADGTDEQIFDFLPDAESITLAGPLVAG